MKWEPEVLAAELLAMGCPYVSTDSRAKAWIEGYQEGMAKARIVYRDAIMAELGVAND